MDWKDRDKLDLKDLWNVYKVWVGKGVKILLYILLIGFLMLVALQILF